ncbi:putative electron transfer flavoprotein, beta subunit [Helianthus annuus]|nr:putative electron transfer flavoprotein, beta subunit [Helianthus annuus]
MSMNPFCEIAHEEALRMKESGVASEVIVVSMGPTQCVDTLRTGLALGADRAVHVDAPSTFYPLTVAKLLKALVQVRSLASSFLASRFFSFFFLCWWLIVTYLLVEKCAGHC